MSSEILNTLKEQVERLSAKEKSILADHLLKQARLEQQGLPAEESVEVKRKKRDVWMKANRERYAGLYVALDGDRLLGTGRNYAEAFEVARRERIVDAFVDFIPGADYVAEMGGW